MSFGTQIPTLRRNVLPPTSE